MESIPEFAYSMAPILIGALVFAVTKRMKFHKYPLVIYFDPENAFVEKDEEEWIEKRETMASYIHDEFLINGIAGNAKTAGIMSIFSKLGIVTDSNLQMLPRLLRRCRQKRIKVVAGSRTGLIKRTLHFDPVGGTLLAYMLEYNLEVVRL